MVNVPSALLGLYQAMHTASKLILFYSAGLWLCAMKPALVQDSGKLGGVRDILQCVLCNS